MNFQCPVKTRLPATLFVAAALLCGCASTHKNKDKTNVKFTDLHSSKIYPGKGGEQTVVDGMDFWLSGEPDRKYQILGLLDFRQGKRGHGHGHVSDMFSDPETEIAEAAKKNGGDAIVVVQVDQGTTDMGNFGSGDHQIVTHYVVIKYVQ